MSWNRKKENEKRLKKNKKVKQENKYDNIVIPSIVALIVWFIAYGYFNYYNKQQPVVQSPGLNKPAEQYKLASDSASATRNSFTLVNKTGGISLPTVPDVFVDFK